MILTMALKIESEQTSRIYATSKLKIMIQYVILKVPKFASHLYEIVRFLTLNWVSFKWYIGSLGQNLQGSMPKSMAKYF